MSGLSYAEVSQKEQKFLDLTSLTVDEFDQLVPAFEEGFEQRMKEWCLDGKPRTERGYRTYANCPLPSPEDRLLFILVYVKTNVLQKWCRESCSRCPKIKPINGSIRYCPSCKRRSEGLGMPQRAR